MCNYSEYIMNKGIEKGIEQGIETGIEKGIEKGMAKTLLALKLLREGKPARVIMKEAQVSPAELKAIKEMAFFPNSPLDNLSFRAYNTDNDEKSNDKNQ